MIIALAKFPLLTALIALAVAWPVRAVLGNSAPPRKALGYLARSSFPQSFTFLRNRLRADHPPTRSSSGEVPEIQPEPRESCRKRPGYFARITS